MDKKLVYWIDDERNPEWFFTEEFFKEFTVIWIKDYIMFEFYLKHLGVPYEIHFDHDLGNAEEHTGLDCAKLLVKYCIDNNELLPSKYACHSSNPAGHDNIMSYLNSYRKIEAAKSRGEKDIITHKSPSINIKEILTLK